MWKIITNNSELKYISDIFSQNQMLFSQNAVFFYSFDYEQNYCCHKQLQIKYYIFVLKI